ncbi:hypothetical protein PV325_004170 [Microctonus aethiopoides]|nr:hypothetical protein PV325_004170 [Microctonus aethiopoides]
MLCFPLGSHSNPTENQALEVEHVLFVQSMLIGPMTDVVFGQDEKIYISMLLAKVIGYRLPNDTIPRSYNIQLEPHIDAENFTFDGISTTIFDVIYPTRDVTLHASHLLEIDKSYTKLVLNNGTTWEPMAQRWNPVLEFFNIRFGHELATGKYTLKLKWLGHEAPNGKGFYRGIDRNENGEDSVMVATHFQATAARNAFPCWDEPGLKAEFEISIKHYHNRTALSNMPLRRESNANDYKIWSHFEKSPPMPTYLVTFVLANYDHIATGNENVTFWTTKDNLANVKLAFDVCQDVITAMEDYTGIPYSLPKLDQVTIPQYTSGATEHWGLISYMKNAILYNVNESSVLFRDGAIQLTIHETAHQWFGNLVTPAWWDDLWLSEAFAVYFTYKISDQIFERWHGVDLFVLEVVNRISYNAESWYGGKHPIKWNPESPDEIRELFGPVTYRKGAAVLFMLEHILSEEVFRDGIAKYLDKHRFGSVTTDDLWRAFQKSYEDKGRHPHLNIKELMDPWLEQTGYPLLNVTRDYESGLANVTQMNAIESQSGNVWMIPISLTTRSLPDFAYTRPTHWMRRSNESLTLYGINRDDWMIINIQQTGFYRVNYDYENWKRLADYLNTNNYYKIHVRNRAQLIYDLLFLASYEDKYFELLIDVMTYLHREINYLPWIPSLTVFERFNSMLINTPAYDMFEKFAVHLISNITNHIGFEDHANEDHLITLGKQEILPWACALGHEKCRNSATNKLAMFFKDPNEYPISPGAQRWVYCQGLMYANLTIWDRVMNAHFANPLNQPGYEFLGCTDDHYIMRKYLVLAMAENASLLIEELSTAFSSIITGRRENFDFALDYFINHIDRMRQYFNARHLTKRIDDIAELLSRNIKNPDQYDKFRGFLDRQKEHGKMSDTKKLVDTARETMEESKKISAQFHALVDKKPSLFELIHGPTYINKKS